MFYIAAFGWIRSRRQRMQLAVEPRAAVLDPRGAADASTAVMCVCVGESGAAGLVYVAVIGVICLPARWAARR